MSNIPGELRYLSSHEWARLESDGETVTVGITDHAQELLGDVVFVELPDVDSDLSAGDEAGVVESVKAASDVFAPVSGTVIEVNEDLEESPDLVNNHPYDDGWFYKIKVSDATELEGLLDADAYAEVCQADD